MCIQTKSHSSSTSTPQSLNLGSSSFGGSSLGLELGNAPNLKEATFYLTPPPTSSLSALTSPTTLTYLFLIGAVYLAYRVIK